jgi:hypothetical protein
MRLLRLVALWSVAACIPEVRVGAPDANPGDDDVMPTDAAVDSAPDSGTPAACGDPDPITPPAPPVCSPVAPWAKSYGGGQSDGHFNVEVQNNGCGYLVSGTTSSFGANKHAWLLALDPEGVIEWERVYPVGADAQAIFSVPMANGDIVVAGWTFDDGFVFRLDATGTLRWSHLYPGVMIRSIQVIPGGGFVVAGGRHDGTWWNVWAGELDNCGAPVWQGDYGLGAAHAVITTATGFLVASEAQYIGGNETWLLALDSDGGITRQTAYGRASGLGPPGSIARHGSGYVIAGSATEDGSSSEDFLVFGIDSAGAITWQRRYGEAGSTDGAYNAGPAAVRATGDGGVAVTGITAQGAGPTDAWAAKLDSDGDIVWQRALGGPDIDIGESIVEAYDGGFVVASESYSFGAMGDLWVVKLSAAGNITFDGGSGAVLTTATAATTNVVLSTQSTTISRAPTTIAPGALPMTPVATTATVIQQTP